jgi:ubiquinone/menaquinone biosynthesis C-methylase UbiE
MENNNEEIIDVYESLWDKYSLAYCTAMNRNSLGLMSTLMALTRSYKKYKILDAGCGPGLGTKQIVQDMPNKDSIVYALDFSKEMINLCQNVFSEFDDFNANSNNNYEIVKYSEQEKINIEKDTELLRKTKLGKLVKFFKGNVENLIFEDEQFDAYISNLCINLCEDVDKALSEAYRVLKKEGIAAFSIWGKKEDTKLAFKLFSQFFNKYSIQQSDDRSAYWLAEDIEGLKEKFNKAGFKGVRMEYMNEIFDCYDEEDYLIKFKGPGVTAVLDKVVDQEKVTLLINDVKNEARKKLIEQNKMVSLNCLVIVAFK